MSAAPHGPGAGRRTTAVVIGAGHAGLAMSHRLTQRSIDHVVLERAEVASSWRTGRWDSLRLLTPNHQTRLPGWRYRGEDPDGYLSAAEVATFITGYATAIDAPVLTGTPVLRVGATNDGYEVVTPGGTWRCATVVVASGGAAVAAVPALAAAVPAPVVSVTPTGYRRPDDLPAGGVLVVGASATGVQLAEEIHRSGRPVTLAVGEHVRLPRTYRGRDIFWWTEAAGILDEPADRVDDLIRVRHLPSPQLVGTPERRSLDLNALVDQGIEIVGRLGRIDGGTARFSGSLANTCRLADLKMDRLLDTLDRWATAAGLDGDLPAPHRFEPTRVPGRPRLEIDLVGDGVRSVVWATGFRPDHSWLEVPVFDRRGRLRHDGGVVEGADGLYVVGLNVLRRRRSSFISGAGSDSAELAHLLHRHLDTRAGPVPSGRRQIPAVRAPLETRRRW